ncbi:MAG: cytochrome C [Xanthomonadaceae bacterium]|nr:cytochrome C [Xanthomonadaceae bacterium]
MRCPDRRPRSASRWLAAAALLLLSLPAAMPLRADEAAPPADWGDRLKACAACHGDEGRTVGDDYYPSIAGKPARYLYNQLVSFRDGRRQHRVMASMLGVLSDRYLGEIATWYAAQPHAKQPAFEGATAGQLAIGERLTVAGDSSRNIPPCQDCHGERLTGVQPSIPGLRGLPSRYLDAQISAWKQGQRQAAAPDCMGRIARSLTAAEITAISAWLASQPYPADAQPAGRLPHDELPIDCGGVLP